MKTITALLVVGLGAMEVHHALNSPPSVEAASNAVASTETKLKDAATTTRDQAKQLSDGLAAPDRERALPQQLEDFNRSTERLLTLRDNLRKDIDDYKTAYNTKLGEFDQERNQIADPSTQRTITSLRRQTEQDMSERINNAQATLDHLDTVITQGTSLQHAAKCIMIADELHQHGTDLDQQLQATQQAANTYASTTSSLLARINHALTE